MDPLVVVLSVYYSSALPICTCRVSPGDHAATCNDAPLSSHPPQAILLSSDGHNLVTGGDNGVVQVWQACDFKQLYVYPGCDAGVRAMDLSHDQR